MSWGTIADWAAVAAALSSMIAAIVASALAMRLADKANDIALLKERRRIYDELWDCLLVIVPGTEKVAPEILQRLSELDRTSEMVFPPRPYAYISSLIREAEAYARHPNRDTVTPEYKQVSTRAAVLNANLRPWINPYLRHERRS